MDSSVVYSSGEFAYRFIHDWAKLPEELTGKAACGITIDDLGFIYTGLKLEDVCVVAVLDKEGNFVRSFGEKLGLKTIHGIWADDDRSLWFSDVNENRLYHTDNDGNVLSVAGGPDACSDTGYNPHLPWPGPLDSIVRVGEPFNQPTKLIRASNGEIYVSDGYGNAALHKFDKELNLLKTWGGPGNAPGQFRLPHAVWEDGFGRIWVADRENGRTQIFDKDGSFLSMFEDMHAPSDIWGDKEHIYVVENKGGISIFDMVPRLVARLGYPSLGWNGCPIGCHSMCGDETGALYLAEIKTDNPLSKLVRV